MATQRAGALAPEGAGYLNILILTRKPRAVPSFNSDACSVRVIEVTKSGDGSVVVPDNTNLVICYPISHSLIAVVQRRADALGIPLVMAKKGASGLVGRILENNGIDLRPYLVEQAEETASTDIGATAPPASALAAQIRVIVAQTVPRLIEQAVARAVDELTELFLEELGELEERLGDVERRVGIVVGEIEGREERHRTRILQGLKRHAERGGKTGRPLRPISLSVLWEATSALKEGKSLRRIAADVGISRTTLKRRMETWLQEAREKQLSGLPEEERRT